MVNWGSHLAISSSAFHSVGIEKWLNAASAGASRQKREKGVNKLRYTSRGLTMVASGSCFRAVKSVGLKVLKNRLSEYVRLAAKGETILVTDRDEVVAELVPPSGSRSPDVADALLADSVRQGWIRPASLPQQGAPTRSLSENIVNS